MKILGIESASLTASAAVWEDERLTAEYTVDFKKTHSQTLLPMIDEIVRMTETDLETIDAIAVSGGPGSFTGLRIGSATAKGLGLALDKPLIHVPTLDAMAYQHFGTDRLICPIMDARRGQVYCGLYEFHSEFQVLKPQAAMDLKELLEEINEKKRPVVFLGDGVPVGRAVIEERTRVPFVFAPSFSCRQRAGAVAALGAEYLKAGRTEQAGDYAPEYLRVSQAEREMLERKKRAEGPAKETIS
ncbi:tRNA (adenosine(37)-N6)-threonylcarbamoyltransferase complex dimerization subunit type 1 TsaB [Lacrimispora sp. NSJ-141]|uniref:tRNA (Adenosine(37)-N6)-threonylcarbamoyltransferase complex dimerization subunit type 1 TsaB n=1 Tax=Lientehia hominis TaxID=2897778 RepID=A0AAP2RKI4_9FIRM|nr:tRNA (adenosine(37)-N6)-threonylcarbamoyltransferase complex dimerization subunit type 1 TsaB [Lientehia hominis]MCD2493717.1 tRNA (adenosine(37)-N6)-threonylcarbamoyltransferase complex dimerization subunit type 1 TsaB [Lientehia hominis]